jgi:uncharacterized protein YcnI
MKSIFAACTIFAASAVQAQAHVTAEPHEAAAGATQEVRFRIGHGCHDTAATTALRVEMPAGLASARPQPKPGWALAITRRPDGTVSAITWTGNLPGDQFDDFAVLVRLPATEGQIYFPAVQTCGGEAERWTDIPAAGAAAPSHPAPSLRLGPAAPDSGHHH